VSVGPDFVVIGAQKSASTALAENLRRHPDIFMPEGETHYFRDPEFHTSEPSELYDLFRTAQRFSRRGIKCPDYLGQEPCAERILEELGRVDIVAVLRDPVARAVSHYFWLVRWGQLPVQPLDEGMRQILRGDHDDIPQVPEILSYGFYGQHLERYLTIFGEDRILVLLDDDLKADLSGSRARVYDFLGVDPRHVPQVRRRSSNEGVYALPRLRLLRQRNRFVYDNGDPMTGRMRRPRRIDQALMNAAVVLADRHIARRLYGNEKPVLDPDIEQKLRLHFAGDIHKTEKLIDRDLSAWLI
jgi:hypothetical protein